MTRATESESLAPAVTRAGAILDLLAENAGQAAGPSELARRLGLPKSSIANICNALADIGPGPAGRDRLRPRPQARRAGRCLPRVGRPRPGVLRGGPAPAGRLRGDHPAGGPRRPRDDLPRPPRRSPAGPADIADRPPPAGDRHRDRQGGAGVARPTTTWTLDWPAPPRCRRLTAELASGPSRRSAPICVAVRERGYSMDDEETVEGVVCFGVMIPGRRPGEGPYAASITLLKARATEERIPLLIDDLHRLADQLSDPLRAGSTRRGRRERRSEAVDRPSVLAEHGRPLRRRSGRRSTRAPSPGPGRTVAASRHTGQSEPKISRSGPSDVERVVDERREVGRRPSLPVRLGHEAAELPRGVGRSRRTTRPAPPTARARRRGSAAWRGGR